MTYLALAAWPLIVLILFRRFEPGIAILGAILGGYLLLPTSPEIPVPLLPDIDKYSVAALPTLLIALFIRHDAHNAVPLPGWIPRNGLIVFFLALVCCGVFLTALTNSEPLEYGPRVLSALTLFDGMSMLLTTLVAIVPFLLARKFLASPEAHRNIVIAFCVAGLIYSFPALYEVRMSPQVNSMVYGFFPHEWIQHRRGSGWRPIVFLHHGLWLSIFFASAVIATAAMIKLAPEEWRPRMKIALAWILMTLVLSKSLGALLIALLILPVIFMAARTQMLMAAALSAAVLFYPALYSVGLTPTSQVTSLVGLINETRAASFQTRVENEEALLEKANRKPLFGWGGWGRARVYDSRGEDVSITDGYWIILLGTGGWTQYLGIFGCLCAPAIILAMRRASHTPSLATSAVCLILTVNLIDLIPNATLTPLTWLLAGALVGRLELRTADLERAESGAPRPTQTGPQYSRFPPHKGHKGRPELTGRRRSASS